ncbi:hypothetical protein ASPWEDRAFT_606328 [Aspergillus wentii DTO 134E9]|uniref:Uncharacterized protein n=1 Tax=Aspergillus wentii DTO 134E9 TaxID=1073089 RepID=A0A1L9RDU2_ASPWE|nr:uncharacterized protein ASPWEDRAFT_606328 [Aspergillus wentii DTO 134E9]OJJ33100.1 hypothetical protein ASPWEDRAFT_606328 [Aspergillus wentii DTO 134E9]
MDIPSSRCDFLTPSLPFSTFRPILSSSNRRSLSHPCFPKSPSLPSSQKFLYSILISSVLNTAIYLISCPQHKDKKPISTLTVISQAYAPVSLSLHVKTFGFCEVCCLFNTRFQLLHLFSLFFLQYFLKLSCLTTTLTNTEQK